ncbi:hypothetical protein [Streptomyces montanisoli]|uniref:hypothetical protein n=1 Tax=Streptomyces montanisoli TaxID=2798581 RepID=UPI001ADFF37F|nr:hypothetical protein [Streptomyces montanisoli]
MGDAVLVRAVPARAGAVVRAGVAAVALADAGAAGAVRAGPVVCGVGRDVCGRWGVTGVVTAVAGGRWACALWCGVRVAWCAGRCDAWCDARCVALCVGVGVRAGAWERGRDVATEISPVGSAVPSGATRRKPRFGTFCPAGRFGWSFA